MSDPYKGIAGCVVVIEPMSSGIAVLAAARELGFETVAATYDRDDRCLSEETRRHVDWLVVVDTNDYDVVTEKVLALHAKRPIVAIIPGFEFYVPIAAKLADRLGLPGLPISRVEGVRNKARMLDQIRRAGLRTPRNATITAASELSAAVAHTGFPCVAKPVDSAGSVHVSRADTLEQLNAAYSWMCTDKRLDLGRRVGHRMLVTEYLDGPEYSIEGYAFDGQVVICSITCKMLGPEPYFVEVGHIVQADLPWDVRETVESYVREVVRVLNITLGPFHCELRLVEGEPVLIEIGARLPGDHIVDLVELATGTSLARAMLAAYAGLGLDDVAVQSAPRAKYAGIRFLTAAPDQRSYREAQGLVELSQQPSVIHVSIDIQAGQPIPPTKDFRCRLGCVVFTADSYIEALERWHSIGEGVQFA